MSPGGAHQRPRGAALRPAQRAGSGPRRVRRVARQGAERDTDPRLSVKPQAVLKDTVGIPRIRGIDVPPGAPHLEQRQLARTCILNYYNYYYHYDYKGPDKGQDRTKAGD